MSSHWDASRDRFVKTRSSTLSMIVLQHDAPDKRHRYQPGQELPITVEDLAHAHVGRSGVFRAQLHLRGPQRDAERLQHPLRKPVAEILQRLRKLPADSPHRFDELAPVLPGQLRHLGGQAGAQPVVELLGRDTQTPGP